MVQGFLSVAQYSSPSGGCGHWAFWLTITDAKSPAAAKSIIFQLIGPGPGEFEFEVRSDMDPARSRRFIKAVAVCAYDSQAAIDRVAALLRAQKLSDGLQWTCQDWIMEALETLNAEEELGDYEYAEVRETLQHDYAHF